MAGAALLMAGLWNACGTRLVPGAERKACQPPGWRDFRRRDAAQARTTEAQAGDCACGSDGFSPLARGGHVERGRDAWNAESPIVERGVERA